MWTHDAYCFPSETDWLAALQSEGWANGTPPAVALLPSGTFYGPPPDAETPADALPGWHVSAAFQDRAPLVEWAAFEIDPPGEMPVLGRKPPPTIADYQTAVEAPVEQTARSRDYASAVSCASYVYSTVPAWAAEATAFVAWRDAVCLAAFATMAQVQQGAPAPGIAALLAGLPVVDWPT